MFREIAIEPEVMAHWEWFLKLYDRFGYDKGMLLAEFPSKSWKREVIERANALIKEGVNQEIKVRSMVSRLQSDRFKESLYSRTRTTGEFLTWLQKAYNAQPSFDAVVAMPHHDLPTGTIAANEFFWEHDDLQAKRQDRIARDSNTLIGACEKMLLKAKQIRFIDRFFNPKQKQKRDPFVRLVDFLDTNNKGARNIQIYTQLVMEDAAPGDYKRLLDLELPTGFTLDVFFLEKINGGENLHPRFILTDLGGMQYDHGLDEGDGTCLVSILESDLRRRLWEEYSPASPVFGRHKDHPHITIGG
jgi:hypothetical protein